MMKPATATIAVPATKPSTPRLSFSQLSCFSRCPLQWALSRSYPPDSPLPAALPLGSAVHAAVTAFNNNSLLGKHTDHRELMAAFTDSWNEATEGREVKYSRNSSAEKLSDLAGKMIEVYVESVPDDREVLATEQKLEIDGILVRGFIDALVVEDGQLYLDELKTSAKPASLENLDLEQIHLYTAMVAHAGIPADLKMPLRSRFIVIQKKAEPTVVKLEVEPSKKALRRLSVKVVNVADCINAGHIYPAKNFLCSSCQWQKQCERWPDLEEGKGA